MMDFRSLTGAARRRLLAQTLSHVADASLAQALTFADHPASDTSWRIGVTGPPGAGKSSLIARLATARLASYPASSEIGHECLAVLAIDPSSPIGAGAVLGDRIRMDGLVDDPRAYVRSIASRGGPEGLAHNIADLLAVTEVYGFDEILLETVGIGQAECAVRALVDSLVVVLHPEAGDSVQAMKAGILELADVYVVNKADLPGAARTAAELRAVLGAVSSSAALTNSNRSAFISPRWDVPVVEISKDRAKGIDELNAALEAHRAHLWNHQNRAATRAARQRFHLRSLVQRGLEDVLDRHPEVFAYESMVARYCAVVTALANRGGAGPCIDQNGGTR